MVVEFGVACCYFANILPVNHRHQSRELLLATNWGLVRESTFYVSVKCGKRYSSLVAIDNGQYSVR